MAIYVNLATPNDTRVLAEQQPKLGTETEDETMQALDAIRDYQGSAFPPVVLLTTAGRRINFSAVTEYWRTR